MENDNGSLFGKDNKNGGAPDFQGGSANFNGSTQPKPNEFTKASEGDAVINNNGDAVKKQKKTTYFGLENDDWPPEGDAVKTTDNARLYMLAKHDIYLKDRYTQKLVKDYKQLHGRTVAKKGGGSKLEITIRSLDIYADENEDKKIADVVVIHPNDDLYSEFSRIAQHKPYQLIIDGDAIKKRATPTETPTGAGQDTEEIEQEEKPTTKPNAPNKPEEESETPTETPSDAVPREMYNLMQTLSEKFENLYNEEKTDRKTLEGKIEVQDREHKHELKVLEEDLSAIAKYAIDRQIETKRLLAAVEEAKQKLPVGTHLNNDVSDIVNAADLARLPTKSFARVIDDLQT